MSVSDDVMKRGRWGQVVVDGSARKAGESVNVRKAGESVSCENGCGLVQRQSVARVSAQITGVVRVRICPVDKGLCRFHAQGWSNLTVSRLGLFSDGKLEFGGLGLGARVKSADSHF